MIRNEFIFLFGNGVSPEKKITENCIIACSAWCKVSVIFFSGDSSITKQKKFITYWGDTTNPLRVNWQTFQHSHIGTSRIRTDAGWRWEDSWYETDVLTTRARRSYNIWHSIIMFITRYCLLVRLEAPVPLLCCERRQMGRLQKHTV
jgi:hypothetical protein